MTTTLLRTVKQRLEGKIKAVTRRRRRGYFGCLNTLRNFRWKFDTQIRPITSHYIFKTYHWTEQWISILDPTGGAYGAHPDPQQVGRGLVTPPKNPTPPWPFELRPFWPCCVVPNTLYPRKLVLVINLGGRQRTQYTFKIYSEIFDQSSRCCS